MRLLRQIALMDRTKAPHPIDLAVGRRIRERRLLLGLSQTAVAERIGISFQALQKYERGHIRVSASRLAALAEVLQVSVAYFFDSAAPNGEGEPELDRAAVELVRAVRQLPTDLQRAFATCMRLAANRQER